MRGNFRKCHMSAKTAVIRHLGKDVRWEARFAATLKNPSQQLKLLQVWEWVGVCCADSHMRCWVGALWVCLVCGADWFLSREPSSHCLELMLMKGRTWQSDSALSPFDSQLSVSPTPPPMLTGRNAISHSTLMTEILCTQLNLGALPSLFVPCWEYEEAVAVQCLLYLASSGRGV